MANETHIERTKGGGPTGSTWSGRRFIIVGIMLGLIGVASFIQGMITARAQTMFSYLEAWIYVVTIAIGALHLLLIINAMRATWPVALRRIIEAMAATLPLLLILFIPIALDLSTLYPWVDPYHIANPHVRELTLKKTAYLNVGFFLPRAGFYFLIWIFVAELSLAWSRCGDRQPTFARIGMRRRTVLAAVSLPFVVLATSFAAFDWVMSLEPAWYSSVFGIYFFAGGMVGAAALWTVLVYSSRGRLLPGRGAAHFYALGRILLAFVLFWAYIAFFQFFLIWIADKPDEVVWYVTRGNPGWIHMSIVMLVGCHFGIAFFALLPYRPKRNGAYLALVGGFLLICHYFDVYWCVAPALHVDRFRFCWLDLGMLFGIGGLAMAFAAWRQRGLPLAPEGDPLYAASLEYRSK